jgi:hypothetical protein
MESPDLFKLVYRVLLKIYMFDMTRLDDYFKK